MKFEARQLRLESDPREELAKTGAETRVFTNAVDEQFGGEFSRLAFASGRAMDDSERDECCRGCGVGDQVFGREPCRQIMLAHQLTVSAIEARDHAVLICGWRGRIRVMINADVSPY